MGNNDYNIIPALVKLGGAVVRCVDLQTGEVLPLEGKSPYLEVSRGRQEHETSTTGLSTYHICGKLEIWENGSLVKVTRSISSGLTGNKSKHIRGKAQFSKGSRRRLMRTMAKINRETVPVFITLTYPAEWDANYETWKRHLKNFLGRLTYNYPDTCGIWRLEFQKRGAPHFHLLIWGSNYYELRSYVPFAWYQTVGSGDVKHLLAGTQVANIKSWRGVMCYASKYLGKVTGETFQDVGRHWGAFSRNKLPWAVLKITDLTDRQAIRMIRYLRRYAHISARMFYSLTIFVSNPSRWIDLVRLC